MFLTLGNLPTVGAGAAMTGVKRPKIPRHLYSVKSKDAKALIPEIKEWFSQPKIQEEISKSALHTRDYLIDYNNTPTEHGGIGDTVPWVHLEDRRLDELLPTTDTAWIDLRVSALRLKTFAEGACRMMGRLNEMDALPEGAHTYIDASTNLIECCIHEKVMRSYFEAKAANKDQSEASSIKLKQLVPTYLYKPSSPQAVLRAKIVQMMSVGLWVADPPQGKKVAWEIRAGPVAVAFHLGVFAPVVQHFQPYLTGGKINQSLGG
ncbi:hypothetical protein HFO91_30665 [Rhizobium leguminosarum]|uniref:hypothetical protein n=1 Tax=Rhizobium leguminosarum TaxID=384 RepID=UPI001C970804|nr:hypothetical protein [Rhizobium leguminosarum]MBY5453944.1 hypothetical protein [Rhizobium leguminosarum]